MKRLVSHVELMELPNSQMLLVKRLSIEPTNSDDRNPGRFERLLGEEPVRTYFVCTVIAETMGDGLCSQVICSLE